MSSMMKAWRVMASLALAVLCTAAGAGTVTYYHNDLAGTPVVATNASGQVIWRESYRPYGERLTNAPASSGNAIWFTSRRQDAETGLVYMGARYYDPVIGRFMSTDPVGFDEKNVHSHNRYAYANNNPYKFVDRDGETATLTLCAGGPAACIIGVGLAIGTGHYAAEGIKGTARALSIYNESAGGAQVPNKPESGDSPDVEKDNKRSFDKGQRDRAVDRARDERGEPRCTYCGNKLTDESGRPNSTEVDHVKAHSKGGRTSDENAAASCRTCNRSKGAKELGTDWIAPLHR